MSKVRIATKEDALIIKDIIDKGISKDYYSIEDINDYIDDNNKYLLVVASDEDKPLAAMFCIKGKLKDMCLNEHITYPDPIFSKYNANTETVVYKTASTYKEVRCKGYVGQLFEEYNNIFNNTEHEIRIGLAIVLPDGTVPIKKHVDKYGFKPTKIFEKPWNKIKSYCTYCGNNYCECNGLLYLKEKRVED